MRPGTRAFQRGPAIVARALVPLPVVPVHDDEAVRSTIQYCGSGSARRASASDRSRSKDVGERISTRMSGTPDRAIGDDVHVFRGDDDQIRLHADRRREHDVDRRIEDLGEPSLFQRLHELELKPARHRLMSGRGSWRHEQISFDELVAPAVLGEAAVCLVEDRAPGGGLRHGRIVARRRVWSHGETS